jgi:hypothetical protein
MSGQTFGKPNPTKESKSHEQGIIGLCELQEWNLRAFGGEYGGEMDRGVW